MREILLILGEAVVLAGFLGAVLAWVVLFAIFLGVALS